MWLRVCEVCGRRTVCEVCGCRCVRCVGVWLHLCEVLLQVCEVQEVCGCRCVRCAAAGVLR